MVMKLKRGEITIAFPLRLFHLLIFNRIVSEWHTQHFTRSADKQTSRDREKEKIFDRPTSQYAIPPASPLVLIMDIRRN